MFCDNPDCKHHVEFNGARLCFAVPTRNGGCQTCTVENHLWIDTTQGYKQEYFLCDNCAQIVKMFIFYLDHNNENNFKAKTWLCRFIKKAIDRGMI